MRGGVATMPAPPGSGMPGDPIGDGSLPSLESQEYVNLRCQSAENGYKNCHEVQIESNSDGYAQDREVPDDFGVLGGVILLLFLLIVFSFILVRIVINLWLGIVGGDRTCKMKWCVNRRYYASYHGYCVHHEAFHKGRRVRRLMYNRRIRNEKQ